MSYDFWDDLMDGRWKWRQWVAFAAFLLFAFALTFAMGYSEGSR